MNDKKPDNIIHIDASQYHEDPQVNKLITVGVKLGVKYAQHLKHIQKMNLAETRLKAVIKELKNATGGEAAKLRKEKMRLGRFLDYGRNTVKTPNFGDEVNAFCDGIVPWMPDIKPATIEDL